MSNKQADWTGNELSRMSAPAVWNKMRETFIIPEEIKLLLIHAYPELNGHENEIEWCIWIVDEPQFEFCYLCAFYNTKAYRNMGAGWSYAGSEYSEKRIARDSLVPSKNKEEIV